jgi:hypothetical protein
MPRLRDPVEGRLPCGNTARPCNDFGPTGDRRAHHTDRSKRVCVDPKIYPRLQGVPGAGSGSIAGPTGGNQSREIRLASQNVNRPRVVTKTGVVVFSNEPDPFSRSLTVATPLGIAPFMPAPLDLAGAQASGRGCQRLGPQ